MKSKLLNVLVTLPAIVWLGYGLHYTLGPHAFQDKIAGVKWMMCGCALVLFYLAGLFAKRTRRAAAAALVSIIILGACIISLHEYRLRRQIRQLEDIYESIAERGKPFPEGIDPSAYDGPRQLRWYYQKNSDTSFAIVYILYSDGMAKEFPGGKWRWIGYGPSGYNPNAATRERTAPVQR